MSTAVSPATDQAVAEYDAVVLSAGIAGLYQLYRLREMGLRVCALDAAADVGGTLYWNCYPGARVDSHSYVYQYWFSEELLQEWNWQERFPAQPETERYLRFVADKFDLRKDIRFNRRVVSARWDDHARRWTLITEGGEVLRTQFFISCAGMLSAPLVPPFPGHERYRGVIAHTARWPRAGLDLTGKRVGVVGTGAPSLVASTSSTGSLSGSRQSPSGAMLSVPKDGTL